MADQYARHFLLSCATAQPMDLNALLENPQNEVGIVLEADGEPIGSVAFLDIDTVQKRAELRKLIGVSEARGKGYAEEATRLWIQYGGQILGLQKIYVSTLQTHLRNIQLNESIGFKVEVCCSGRYSYPAIGTTCFEWASASTISVHPFLQTPASDGIRAS